MRRGPTFKRFAFDEPAMKRNWQMFKEKPNDFSG